jgi:hypothetical protein
MGKGLNKAINSLINGKHQVPLFLPINSQGWNSFRRKRIPPSQNNSGGFIWCNTLTLAPFRLRASKKFAPYSRLVKCKAESAGKSYGT